MARRELSKSTTAAMMVTAIVVVSALATWLTEEEESESAATVAARTEPEPRTETAAPQRRASALVDGVEWRVTSTEVTPTVADEPWRESADGVYVVLRLDVHNTTDRARIVNNDDATLFAGGTSYDTDNEATASLGFSGERMLILESLAGGASTWGLVVFDVPGARGTARICFGGARTANACLPLRL
jgi:hypothetical protein